MPAKRPSLRYTVDRRENEFLVLVDAQGRFLDVPASALPADCRRVGAVLDAPVSADGNPQWAKASRNRAEEQSRLRASSEELARLRGRPADPSLRSG
jgi:hypothetical protein